jgi:copper chaperone CopZ
MIKNLVMSVDGMQGTKCEHKVKSAVGGLDGVRKVEVDVPGKLVAVSLDPSAVTENQIRNAIAGQGYRIT